MKKGNDAGRRDVGRRPVRQGEAGLNRTANILGALAVALNDRITSEVSKLSGVSPSAVSALIQIYFYPGISVEKLRYQIGLSHSASVRVVDILQGGCLVERHRITSSDARLTSLFATAGGRELVESILDRRNTITREIVSKLPPDEQEVLERIVCSLMTSLVRPGQEQELVCRFCDLSECPQDICPMELMDQTSSPLQEKAS